MTAESTLAEKPHPMYPDEIVDSICQEIAYNKGKISFNQLWSTFSITTRSMQKFLLQCCLNDDSILLIDTDLKKEIKPNGDSNPIDDYLLKSDQNKYSLAINEDKLWTILTGYNKKECKIGNFAFELLLEIANSKSKGINTIELARVTGQDSRSITGRLKKIEHLTSSVQLLYKGHVVKKLTLKKLAPADNDQTVKPYVRVKDHLAKIVDVVKNSKNGIRQTSDLKRELNLDKDKRLSKAFITAISWLDEKGYLKKVLVISPKNAEVKIRCVQFQRDYVDDSNKNGNGFIEENSDEDDEDENDNINDAETSQFPDDIEENEVFEGFDTSNATNILRDESLVVDDSENNNNNSTNININGKLQPIRGSNEMLLNRFYPFQNQTFDLADKAGETGLSTIDAIKYLCGREYQRSFTKSSENYIETVGKEKIPSAGFNLVKMYDFEGKRKFHRVFTEDYFRKFSGQPIPPGFGTFKTLKIQKNSIDELNKRNFVALNTTLRFGKNQNDEDVFFWHGDNVEELSYNEPVRASNKKKTKKHRLDEGKSSDNKKQKTNADTDEEHIDQTNNIDNNSIGQPGTNKGQVTIDGFSAKSIVSLKRQKAILEILRRSGGFTFIRDSFFDEVSKFIGSSTLVDKKTLSGDLDSMIKNNKVALNIDRVIRKRYIYLPDLDENAIKAKLQEDKDSKKSDFSDIIQQTDVYFFDQSAETRFNRESKAVQRLRNFEQRTRTAAEKKKIQKEKRSGRSRKKRSKEKVSSKKQQKVSKVTNAPPITVSTERNRNIKMSFYLDKNGIEVLIKAVVITKSIKNEIQWDSISALYPKNSLNNLKKKWMSRRVRMGHAGWKLNIEKWRKILVKGINDEVVTLDDVENLNLPILLQIWFDYEYQTENKPFVLFKDYNENKKHYTLARDTPQYGLQNGIMMSSMVQRETALLKHTFTCNNYEIGKEETYNDEKEGQTEESNIRSVVRSTLVDKNETGMENIDVLKNIPKETLDKVILDMAKEKQIYLNGTRLAFTNTVKEFFESDELVNQFEEEATYCAKLNEFLSTGNGVIISEEINDIGSWVLIDLIERSKVNLDIIPMERKKYRFYYSSRRYEISSLTPPLVLTMKDKNGKLYDDSNAVPIPLGKPYSRLWINATGHLRENMWKLAICFVINIILFRPGITVEKLAEANFNFLSTVELQDICTWLVDKHLLNAVSHNGYMATNNWYRILA